jgi:hypothetical protein
VRSLLVITLVVLAPAALRAQEPRRIARYGFDDGVVAIDVRPGGIIAIAGAQGDSAATVAVRASDARTWVDSTRRFVTRSAPRKRAVVVLQRSMVEEADSGGAISFLRRAERDTTTFELLFSTRDFGKFPLTLQRREAALFFDAMRRAIVAARPPAPAKRPPKAKQPPAPAAP